MSIEMPSHAETMQRYIRDSAVAEAVATHADHLKNERERRLVHEIAQLAVHTALTQYAARMAGDIARIESFHRMRADEAMLRPSQSFADMFRGTWPPTEQPGNAVAGNGDLR